MDVFVTHGIASVRVGIDTNSIIPDDYQAALIAHRDRISSSYFAIGDIANELLARNASAGSRVTDQMVFDAIGRIVGKAGRTVRYYAETAGFFRQEVRDHYHALPFCHFVVARQFRDRWEDVLEFAALSPIVTAESLRAEFLRKELGCPPDLMREVSRHLLSSRLDALKTMSEIEAAEPKDNSVKLHGIIGVAQTAPQADELTDNQRLALKAINGLEYSLQVFERALNGLQLPESIALEAIESIARIERLLPKIISEVV